MAYVAPKVYLKAFTCPLCGAYSQMEWYSASLYLNPDGNVLRTARCVHCGKWSIWHLEKMVSPQRGNAPLPNADMPASVQEDYEEASTIAAMSPRGAAALLRLALQKLCKELGEKGDNINDDIASLVKKGLNATIQQSLDLVRVIGNNAVHPGQIDADDPAVVGSLFQLLNIIVEAMLSQPKAIQAMYANLPPSTLKGIEDRAKK